MFFQLLALFTALGIWIFSIIWNLSKALDTFEKKDARKHYIAAAVLAIVGITLLTYHTIKHEEKAPCVKYSTIMQYNAATKTMMPVRYCEIRGEWEE